MTYASLVMVKEKLRIPATDSTIDDELNIYIDEVDVYIDRILKERFGSEDEYGYPITLPLTESTRPALTFTLKVVASDLVEGKFRLKTTEEISLWMEANAQLEKYILETYGWNEGGKFKRTPSITITPTNGSAGSTITMTGTDFKPRGEISIKIVDENGNGVAQTTSPAVVLTDDNGDFNSVTFATATTDTIGSYEIVAHDKINHSRRNFTVTS